MGGHKKKLRAEKAKVKLKGAKLPKGLNVTKTDFKVRKITIREQLKESQYVDGQRVVNLKEILTRLKHQNSSYRREALRILKENIASGKCEYVSNLNELVQSIAAICLDVDKEIRRESFKVLSNLLAALGMESVSPFFNIISSYLRCAMTHIQPAIQDDSMLLLDVLLQQVPSLVAADSNRILRNFLEMISTVRTEEDKSRRTLTVNMSNKQTTIKWRSKILQRLQHMLHILAVHKEQNSTTLCGSTRNRKQLTHTFSSGSAQYFPLMRCFPGSQECDLTSVFCKSVGESSNNTILPGALGLAVTDFQDLKRYITHLMPLLFESWLEVRSKPATTTETNFLITQDAAVTLRIVLNIIESIWTLVDVHEREVNNADLSSWLCDEYAPAFVSNFLQGSFPYQQEEKSVQKIKKDGAGQKSKQGSFGCGDSFCIQQNIYLCFLMSRFYSRNVAEQAVQFSNLLKYVTSIIDNLKACPLETFACLEKALRSLLHMNGMSLLQIVPQDTRSLLSSTVTAFLNNEIPTKEGLAAKVLVLLCDIAQNLELFHGYGAKNLNDFIVFLPQLLLRATITEQALLSMSNLAKQKNTVLTKALKQLIVPVIENLQKIQVHGACNVLEGKKHIMNLFYWLEDDWSAEEQRELRQKVQDCVNDKRMISYFNFIISRV